MIKLMEMQNSRQVVVDINTQRDLFLAGGKACIRNHRGALKNIRRIMAWARHNKITVISICEFNDNKHRRNDIGDYCIDGTNGQNKIGYTILKNRTGFSATGSTDLPRDILRTHDQIILDKRCPDPFKEPLIERLLDEVHAEFILIGATTEDSVMLTALGLLQRKKRVTIIKDAIGCHNYGKEDMALSKMKAKGAGFIKTRELAGVSSLRRVGICHCVRCKKTHKEKTSEVLQTSMMIYSL